MVIVAFLVPVDQSRLTWKWLDKPTVHVALPSLMQVSNAGQPNFIVGEIIIQSLSTGTHKVTIISLGTVEHEVQNTRHGFMSLAKLRVFS